MSTTIQGIIRFETGKTYYTKSICDSEIIYKFKIERRNMKSVWIMIDGKLKRRALKYHGGSEYFEPFGNYSMSPMIKAERELKP